MWGSRLMVKKHCCMTHMIYKHPFSDAVFICNVELVFSLVRRHEISNTIVLKCNLVFLNEFFVNNRWNLWYQRPSLLRCIRDSFFTFDMKLACVIDKHPTNPLTLAAKVSEFTFLLKENYIFQKKRTKERKM